MNKIAKSIIVAASVVWLTVAGSLLFGQIFPGQGASFLSAILGIGLGYIGGMIISEIWGWV